MISRRNMLFGAAAISAWPTQLSAQPNTLAEFDAEFTQALGNVAALDATRREREGFADEYEYYQTRTTAPRIAPSSRSISERARALLILFEVTGRERYQSQFTHPIRPGGQSGVTIGIGYDIAYALPAWLKEDWAGLISDGDLARLKIACGKPGPQANALSRTLRDITISWEAAETQFRSIAVPRWTAATLAALPNAAELSDHSLGALVSLVYNRGPSFRRTGNRYRHMREIRRLIGLRQFDDVPAQLLAMRDLWPPTGPVAGLRTRRMLEAKLFQVGLA